MVVSYGSRQQKQRQTDRFHHAPPGISIIITCPYRSGTPLSLRRTSMNITRRQPRGASQRLCLAAILLLAVCTSATAAAQRYDLLVQGALDSELQPLLSALEGARQVQLDAWTFWTGRIAGKRVVVSRTEVGPL